MKKESKSFSDYPIQKILKKDFHKYEIFENLLQINDCPDQIFYRGKIPKKIKYSLAVVGSRAISDYGRSAMEKIFENLDNQNITIISGLALGTDALAHEHALKKNLPIIAIPGSGIDEKVLYPKTNKDLALRILNSGGIILSEFEPTFQATPWTFPARNRIMAAIAQKILLVEATEKSGTIITARLAVEYNKDLLCIPGSIFSSRSEATNRLIREGATPILNSNHILEEFRINIEKLTEQKIENLSPDEKLILALLDSPKEKDHLVKESKLSVPDFLTALTMLEINNLIKINGTSISKK